MSATKFWHFGYNHRTGFSKIKETFNQIISGYGAVHSSEVTSYGGDFIVVDEKNMDKGYFIVPYERYLNPSNIINGMQNPMYDAIVFRFDAKFNLTLGVEIKVQVKNHLNLTFYKEAKIDDYTKCIYLYFSKEELLKLYESKTPCEIIAHIDIFPKQHTFKIKMI